MARPHGGVLLRAYQHLHKWIDFSNFLRTKHVCIYWPNSCMTQYKSKFTINHVINFTSYNCWKQSYIWVYIFGPNVIQMGGLYIYQVFIPLTISFTILFLKTGIENTKCLPWTRGVTRGMTMIRHVVIYS